MKNALTLLPLFALAACNSVLARFDTPTPIPFAQVVTPAPTRSVAVPIPTHTTTCDVGAHDAHVYAPSRLQSVWPCIQVAGVVKHFALNNANGEYDLEVELDAQYKSFLTPANYAKTNGRLRVTIICYATPTEEIARKACENFPEKLRIAPPAVGQSAWFEGRLVVDRTREEIAAVHPLYRWGTLK